jgi:hypothetical protein
MVRALLAADTDEEFAAMVAAHPALLGGEADAAIWQLAEAAYNEGQRDVADALHELRRSLARIRSGPADRTDVADRRAGSPTPVEPSSVPADAGQLPALDAAYQIGDVAYQRLLHVASRDELIAITRDYPALLEEWADAELAERADAALDEGNERLAGTIEERREVLAALRAEVGGQAGLARAVQALMEASSEEDMAHALDEYPILLTDAAQDALLGLAAGARAQGDDELAEYTIERRALLRKVRAGLEAS